MTTSGELGVLLTALPPSPYFLTATERCRNKSNNAEKSTNTWARRFTDWLEKNSIRIVAGETSSSELDKHFFTEL